MRLIDCDALIDSLRESVDRCREWISDCEELNDLEMKARAEQALYTFNECIMRANSMPRQDEIIHCKECERDKDANSF